MKRKKINPRNNWQKKVEEKGFLFHTLEDTPYWDETACYEFSAKQVEILETATNELHKMCTAAADHVIQNNLFYLFGIPEHVIPLIKEAWDKSDDSFWSMYGRFDFAYDGINPPKMLEFNADTPTSLFEASVIQYYWLQDFNAKFDQFNSIDEKLLETWKWIHERYNSSLYHFACIKNASEGIHPNQLKEDITTTAYVVDVASRVSGLKYNFMDISDIGWDGNQFVDEEGNKIETMFKLYPWEWMANEEYGERLPESSVNWIEPIWKMIWSNKAILPILWELFPNSEYLLPAYFEPRGENYVKKPKLSREGANVSIIKEGVPIAATHDDGYGEEGYVYQDIATIPCIDGNYPIIGSWVIGGESAGIGIRETTSMITDNQSRFIPHYFI
jgi:glutathionylspermidine synthase